MAITRLKMPIWSVDARTKKATIHGGKLNIPERAAAIKTLRPVNDMNLRL